MSTDYGSSGDYALRPGDQCFGRQGRPRYGPVVRVKAGTGKGENTTSSCPAVPLGLSPKRVPMVVIEWNLRRPPERYMTSPGNVLAAAKRLESRDITCAVRTGDLHRSPATCPRRASRKRHGSFRHGRLKIYSSTIKELLSTHIVPSVSSGEPTRPTATFDSLAKGLKAT
ncbi:hypothetical protein Bbelb_427900, partial [Branchiostoma belcheri]